MGEYLHIFLTKRFKSPLAVVEYGYNLVDALERYGHDPDCAMFYKVLKGEISMEVWEHSEAEVDGLLAVCREMDRAENAEGGAPQKLKGMVPKALLFPRLPGYFASKSLANIEVLTQALDSDQPGPFIEYENLTEEDRDGNQGEFIEAVRNQYIEEREAYVSELFDALLDRSEATLGPNAHSPPITVPAAREAILAVDPAKPAEELGRLVNLGFMYTGLRAFLFFFCVFVFGLVLGLGLFA
jgi:hypothetical protein